MPNEYQKSIQKKICSTPIAKFKNWFMPFKNEDVIQMFNTKKYTIKITPDRQFVYIYPKPKGDSHNK